jgi:hypothetical protein
MYSILSPLVKHQPSVEMFKVPRTIPEKTAKLLVPIKPKVVLPSPDEEVYLAPPTRQIVPEPRKEVVVVPEPRKEVVVVPEPRKEVVVVPEPRKEVVVVPEPRKERGALDPICIGIEARDAMYAIATSNVKQSIECEEARILEGKLDELYKSQNGRSRGWVKTALTEFIVPRAAAGGRVPQKQIFDWSAIWTDKKASAALDFVCLAKGIRLAVWHDKTVGIWPAADSATNPPLFHVSSGGVPLHKKTVFEDGWALRAPLSVEHALEKLSISELDTLSEKMGVTLSGKKSDRVRTLASARMRLRFTGN